MGRRARSSLIKYLSNPSSGSSSEDTGCASQGKCEVVKCNSYDRNSVYIKYTCVLFSNVCMRYCLKKKITSIFYAFYITHAYIYIHTMYCMYTNIHTYTCHVHTHSHPGEAKKNDYVLISTFEISTCFSTIFCGYICEMKMSQYVRDHCGTFG